MTAPSPSRRRSPRPRGWMLLTTLFLLLAISFVVAAFYAQSADYQLTGISMRAYAMANSRAQLGSQVALAAVRANANLVDPISGNCSDIDPWTTCPSAQRVGPIALDNGPARDLIEGGGLQYHYIVYRPILNGANTNLYTIRARGFYGYSDNAAPPAVPQPTVNTYTSEVEITVEIGENTGFKCTSYDCM